MYSTQQKCGSIGTTEFSISNTAEKFRAYRLAAESMERKFKEAEIVIQQLKVEINFSRNVEKNLRSQVSSAQDRLICQEKLIKQFLTVSVKNRQHEQISQQIEKKLEKIVEKLNQTREESKNVFQYASKELELLKKIKDLEAALNTKERDNDLKNMEIQTLTKEKENIETEFQQKIQHLENELQMSIKKEAESLALSRETLLYYKKQIEDYEEKVEYYKNERKSYLEDFAPPERPKSNSENFPLADSTVNTEERSPTCKKRCLTQIDKPHNQIFQCSSILRKTKPAVAKKGKEQNYQRVSGKQKPQLEFLSASQNSSPVVKSAECGRKRRLFSTNCNHYID